MMLITGQSKTGGTLYGVDQHAIDMTLNSRDKTNVVFSGGAIFHMVNKVTGAQFYAPFSQKSPAEAYGNGNWTAQMVVKSTFVASVLNGFEMGEVFELSNVPLPVREFTKKPEECRCQAKTKKGKQCTRKAIYGYGYCSQHVD